MESPHAKRRLVAALLWLAAAPALVPADEPAKVCFPATDGYWIHADHYGPTSRYNDAATVILLHDCDNDRTAWKPLIEPLREAGFVVLALDLRGHGESAAADTRERVAQGDPQLAGETQHDLRGAYDWLAQQTGTDRARFALVGAGSGAGIALRYAVRDRSVDAIVCLSPQRTEPGLDPLGDMGQIRGRSILLLANADERASCEALAARGDHAEARILKDAGRGTDLLGTAPQLPRDIVDFLIRSLGPPSEAVVYGSIQSNIYHAPGSGWIARISPTNLRCYSSPAEAKARGLRAAKNKGPRGSAARRQRRSPDSPPRSNP